MRAVSAILLTITAASISAKPMENQNVRQARQQITGMLQNKIDNTPFRLGEGINSFSNDIYAELSKASNGNLAFSPFSLHTALAMTFFGSPADSRTHLELANVLGLRTRFSEDYSYNFLKLLQKYENLSSRNSGAVVSVANRIFADDSFTPKEEFTTWLNIFYRTEVESVNFSLARQATDRINQFVAQKTKGVIRDLMDESDVDGLTKMVLINALYFKSNWQYQFKKSATKSKIFSSNPGQRFNYAKTMFNRGNFGTVNLPEINSRMLELPYTNPSLRMLVILPNEGVDIRDVDSNLDRLDIASIDRRMVFGPTMVQLPAFDTTGSLEVSEVLQNLGVKTLFNPRLANLDDISDTEDLAVDKVIHKAVVKVDEEGSEAAAATAVGIGTRNAAAPTSTVQFQVDRPFLFIIQDIEARVPLFVGRIVDPSGQRRLKSRGPTSNAGKREALASIISSNIANLPNPAFAINQPEPQPQQQSQPQQSVLAQGQGQPESFRLVEDSDDVLGAVIVDADEPLDNGERSNQDLPNCDDVTGFKHTNAGGEEISFPCRGRETAPVSDHQEAQEQEREMRIGQFLNQS